MFYSETKQLKAFSIADATVYKILRRIEGGAFKDFAIEGYFYASLFGGTGRESLEKVLIVFGSVGLLWVNVLKIGLGGKNESPRGRPKFLLWGEVSEVNREGKVVIVRFETEKRHRKEKLKVGFELSDRAMAERVFNLLLKQKNEGSGV